MWVKRNTFLQGIKVVAFLVVLVILWDIVNAIFVNGPDSHKYLFKNFYEAPVDEVDVVYMGASSTCWNWNPVVAYHENGVASQMMGSERLAPDALPYLIKEARQKDPKLYIVDAQRLVGTSNDFIGAQGAITNLRISKHKMDAMKDILEEYTDEEKLWGYFPIAYFHNRWKSLGYKDFKPADYDFLGYSMRAVAGTALPQGKEQLDAEPRTLNGWQLENLNKVLRVCSQLDGQVLFVIAPNNDGNAGYYRYIQDVVTKAGFDYINAKGYLEEMGIEIGDMRDISHLTMYGAEKYTTWLSGVVAEKYNLPDRREQANYKSAVLYESEYEDYIENKVNHGVMLGKYLESITETRYSVLIAARDEASAGLNNEIVERLRKLGLRTTPAGGYRSAYLGVVDHGNLLLEQVGEPEGTEPLQASGALADGTPFILQSGGNQSSNHASIIVDGVEYAVNSRGLNIVVYDNFAHKVIDSVAFDTFDQSLAATRGIPNLPELKISAEEVSAPKVTGTSRVEGIEIPNGQKARVRFDDVQHGKTLYLSLDANDIYNILLCRGERVYALYTVWQEPEQNNLRSTQIELSDGDAAAGFDSLMIVPVKGDGKYSVGHVIVL